MKKFLRASVVFLLSLGISVLCACAGSGVSVGNDSSGNVYSEEETSYPAESASTSGGEEEPEEESGKYGYEPVIEATMPRIDIVTENLSYATDYDRDAKLAGKIEYVSCTVSMSNCDEAAAFSAVPCKVKARGNYTLDYPKKPLRLKFDKKLNLLGMNGGNKYKSWVLLADYKDSSMLRNVTSFYFGKTILGSDGYYSADYRNVEVYLNGQYWGVYLLTEQQQTGTDRVDIAEPEENYTGTDIGYFVEYDGYYSDEENRQLTTFEVGYYGGGRLQQSNGGWTNALVNGYTIQSDVYSTEQTRFIKSYIGNVYEIIYRAVYENSFYEFNGDYTGIVKSSLTDAQEVIAQVVDLQSLADMYILQEIACDYDINWSSFYMSADMSDAGNKKLTFQAPWDFDSAYGAKTMESGRGIFAANSQNPWMVLLSRQSWFTDLVKAKWAELYAAGVPRKALEQIKTCKSVYAEYYNRNFNCWPGSMGHTFGELYTAFGSFRTEAAAAVYLYNWLYTRLNYLNGVWGNGADILA